MSDSTKQAIPEIDVQEAKQRINAGAILVDVREQNEYDEAHIPGSHLLALSNLAENYAELPKDKPLIMQCRSGARSGQATQFLLQNGYSEVVNLKGGILAWGEADLPIERTD